MTFIHWITLWPSCVLLSTDTRFKLIGKTVFYIPMEALQHNPKEAANDKMLLQRLEGKRGTEGHVIALGIVWSNLIYEYKGCMYMANIVSGFLITTFYAISDL